MELINIIIEISKHLSSIDYKHNIIYHFLEREAQNEYLTRNNILLSYLTQDNFIEHKWVLRAFWKKKAKEIFEQEKPIAVFVTHRYGKDISTHTITNKTNYGG